MNKLVNFLKKARKNTIDMNQILFFKLMINILIVEKVRFKTKMNQQIN